MAFLGRANYEIHILKEDRWVVDDIVKNEQQALAQAEALFRHPDNEGVRVLREWKRGEEEIENEVLCRIKTVTKKDDFSLTDVDQAPFCTKVGEYYETASRVTIGRMFSKYLERYEMTPTELLYDHKTLKRLMNFDTLVPSAVDRIAKLHARTGQVDQKTRRDEIFDAVEKIHKRAKRTADAKVPELKDFDLDAVLAQVDAEEEDERRRIAIATTSLVQASLGWRGWIAKMGRLLPMARAQQDARALQLIDSMVADILNAKTVVKDVLGVSKHLGDAIMRMCDLLEGHCAPTQFADEELLEILNELFAAGGLPESRQVIITRISRDLKGVVRITNSELEEDDRAFFLTMIDRLVTDEKVVGGGEVAQGLAERWSRLENIGGTAGRLKAIESLVEKLEIPKRQFVFYLSLLDSRLDAELEPKVVDQLDVLIARLASIQAIAPNVKSDFKRLQQARSFQDLILGSTLQDDLRHRMGRSIDNVVTKYIVEERVIERMDDQSMPFKDRADRLVQFCSSGVLTEGRATEIARDRITTYLRRKDFVAEYTADIPDAPGKEAAVRDFYKLLATTGFNLSA